MEDFLPSFFFSSVPLSLDLTHRRTGTEQMLSRYIDDLYLTSPFDVPPIRYPWLQKEEKEKEKKIYDVVVLVLVQEKRYVNVR